AVARGAASLLVCHLPFVSRFRVVLCRSVLSLVGGPGASLLLRFSSRLLRLLGGRLFRLRRIFGRGRPGLGWRADRDDLECSQIGSGSTVHPHPLLGLVAKNVDLR